jgi:hypothetical protein
VEPTVTAKRTHEGFLNRIANLRASLAWMLVVVGGVAGALIGVLQSWGDGALTLASASGLILGFQLWAGSRSAAPAWRCPRLAGMIIAPAAALIEAGRARWWRRIVASALTKPGLSPSAKGELVDLLAERHDRGAVADLLPWARNSEVPPEVRLQIAEIAARSRFPEGIRLLRRLSENAGTPSGVRFDAAESLLSYDEPAAERCLEMLARSGETDRMVRLEAAAVLSERTFQGVAGGQGPEVLALLVGDAAAGNWVRIEACKLLRLHGTKRYRQGLWGLANDSRLTPHQRMRCAHLLAEAEPDEGERGWTALALDSRLPFWARIEAATQLEEEGSAFALKAMLKDPDIDDRTKFDVVRKLTLLDLSQVRAGVADRLCDT